MEVFLLVCFMALGASLLTFYSGFGLGTLLTPVFILFFPAPLAIALTGVVHLFNNLFKLVLVGKKADFTIVIQFGIPAVIAALIGSVLMMKVSEAQVIYTYDLYGKSCYITILKLIISLVLIIFASIEFIPYFDGLKFDRKLLPLGGAFSGFFGGLTGNQGALRAAFLLNARLSKEAFVGTTCVVSTLVDLTRLSVYYKNIIHSHMMDQRLIVICAVLSAGLGTWIGNKYLKKISLPTIQKITVTMLLSIAILIGSGIL